MDTLQKVLVNSLYILALLNPVSKVAVLAMLPPEDRRGTRAVALQSSIVAAGILLSVMIFGDIILRDIFRVQLYSLRIAGGGVLFITGLNALRKGVFFEKDQHARFADLAIVPLACPMIAGPATIAASVTLTAHLGRLVPVAAVLLALAVNTVIMLFSGFISGVLSRFNILGAIIRMTGLIVMTMGVQMVLDGTAQWVANLAQPS